MYVLYVTIYVKPTNVQEFLVTTREHARLARQEPGNVRYDLLQSEDDATCFVLYEAYRTKQDGSTQICGLLSADGTSAFCM